ncbi:MAG: diguanylate cyclase [Sulfuricurvum sp.]|nr:diguanylate cyclase [Sulfuricurvum sp.]
MKLKSLKTKILLILSAVIVGVAMSVTSFTIAHDKQQEDIRMDEAYRSVHLNYLQTLQDTVSFYTARSHANLSTVGVLEAFRTANHDELYRLIAPRWKVMQQENPALAVMQFHNGDGTSLLRMHRPDVYGDRIAEQRPMIAHIHKYHKALYGFEEGRQGLAFRIVVPVMENGVYLGAVEFGLSASYITDKINRYTGYNSFFLVNQNNIGNLSSVDNGIKIGDMIALNVSAPLLPLVRMYQTVSMSEENLIIRSGGQSFVFKSILVADYDNHPIGKVMFVRMIPDFWSHSLQMALMAGFIALVLIIVLGILISRLYDSIANKLSFQEMYNQTILDAIPSPIIVTDGHQIIAANQTFLAYFDYDTIEHFKREHNCVCEYFEKGDTDDYLLPMMNDQRWTEYINNHPLIDHKAKITIDGKTTVFDVKLSLLRFKEESRYVVIFTDISSMQSISMTDPLTSIANRLHFTMVYEHAINVARREENPLSVIFFDIDHFKQVNDRYGHLIGDTVLKQIAHLAKQRLRKSDIIARWGGEEFIILLPDTTLVETVHIAEILRSVIANEELDTVGYMSCSFGVAQLNENESADEFLKRVDDLLYQAKHHGRNRVVH